ncbi:MAG: two-component system response regulator NarL [Thiobacillus sp.]|uniref:two-component system response regulator NarL n=1 Tax=unclassified Thiobacillus TaxID=2646513 RepID=UPI00086E1890|nr:MULTISPECIES: two-component system response regulator NarL [unclassified Thiobacillus]MBN8770127.1 two-component system response regulator NarL [Thiobacillus sp.]MBN8781069.1 two-component system response regulator NarL [Thiobacillus sp.]ODV04576.1 MAG: two-component system response regulator NarL [Thiobacillus sp. SCN 63-57]OJY56515.1 MAG: two-component system response regulator NarL [Thiobacillus sp. 0-1251]
MNPSDTHTILVVDDHPLFRKGVIQLIQATPEFRFVGEAPSGKEGIQLAQRLHPDMILLDLNMKDMNGVDVLKAIKEEGSDSRVIMLTVSDQAEDLMAALQAGADGYLLKDMEPEDLMQKLVEAAHGKITISERLTQLLVASLREKSRPTSLAEAGLTEQESRILDHLAGGKSNKLIARDMNIAEGTVKVHVKHLLKKLNLRSRVEAAVWADRCRRQVKS